MEGQHEAGRSPSSIRMSSGNDEDVANLRRGPWTVDEDLTLINHIANHGEGRWNSLARTSGLRRTGKSCRLRWLNYLHPDVRRGNITLEEQLLILQLHSQWGNQWSKIAQHLPGRTDNEIKNYWRTRVQKHMKQPKCDLWMPRLEERIQDSAAAAGGKTSITSPEGSTATMMRVQRYTVTGTGTGTDPDNSCTTPPSSEYSDPFYPVPSSAYGDIFCEEYRGNPPRGQSGGFDHAGYYHRLSYGMEFQAMDHHHHHQHDGNDQTDSRLWNNVVEDVNYWSLQND